MLINRGFLWRTDVCLLINGPGNWDTRRKRGGMSWWGICINPITFSPVHGTVLAPIYHTERCLLRSTSRANARTIQNFPTSAQELSLELTVLTFKLSNQITLQQPVDTTAISRTHVACCPAFITVEAMAVHLAQNLQTPRINASHTAVPNVNGLRPQGSVCVVVDQPSREEVELTGVPYL